jgi:Mn2+/Fe2+ NRAMP family transporter
MNAIPPAKTLARAAVLDAAHVGDIHGALGSISRRGHGNRRGPLHRLRTLLAIVGPGLIVMVGDNDAGAFATYTQAGQNYGTTLMWTLLLLVPVLYVNQEMVLRLGAVTGVGHARLILERFGRFWGAFSVIDLFILNGLTIVTEFIGISLALDQLGVSRGWGVAVAAVLTIIAAGTGDFRRFERFAMMLVLGSLLLIPVFVAIHPPLGQVAHDFLVPQMPGGKLSDVMLLIIAIVGTTVAPWQLFFQQSYVIDKRITPRFIPYEKIDLWLGIVIVILGAVAMVGFAAATFAGTPEAGAFTDAGGVAAGLGRYVGHVPQVLFAIALLDASIIGTAAVSLSTAYAVGDVLSLRHSLHRKPGEAKAFYVVYAGVIAVSAALVLVPGAPLGLITVGVQTLAGVLLPSATVFLLLLCNDRAVLGPWVNGAWLNLFTSAVIAVLVLLSLILTAAVLFPDLSEGQILAILGGGGGLAAVGLAVQAVAGWRQSRTPEPRLSRARRAAWRMPALDLLPPARLGGAGRIWLLALWAYLALACAMVVLRVVQVALGDG